jgi:hypothetical protein
MRHSPRIPYIPRRTREELQAPAPPGGRHNQMVRVAVSLIGQGITPEAVFAQLRSNYDQTVPDKHIMDIVKWAAGKSFTPCTPGSFKGKRPDPQAPVTRESAAGWAKRFLKGDSFSEAALWSASPWPLLNDFQTDAQALMAGLYDPQEHINIVSTYRVITDEAGNIAKATPQGAGRTLTRTEWLAEMKRAGTPESKAGGWVRMNPVRPKGSGTGGAITDADVTAYRFLLLENDLLPIADQVSVLAKLPLPISAILTSGGKSLHAWVKVDAGNAEAYRSTAREILTALSPMGFDPGTKNASRLSRLPGTVRQIGGTGDKQQRLLFLNPHATGTTPISKL